MNDNLRRRLGARNWLMLGIGTALATIGGAILLTALWLGSLMIGFVLALAGLFLGLGALSTGISSSVRGLRHLRTRLRRRQPSWPRAHYNRRHQDASPIVQEA